MPPSVDQEETLGTLCREQAYGIAITFCSWLYKKLSVGAAGLLSWLCPTPIGPTSLRLDYWPAELAYTVPGGL